MKKKRIGFIVICSLLVTSCGTTSSQTGSITGTTLAELEKAKTSQELLPTATPSQASVKLPGSPATMNATTNTPTENKPNTDNSNHPAKPSKPIRSTGTAVINKTNNSSLAANSVPTKQVPAVVSDTKPKPQQPPSSKTKEVEKGSNYLKWDEFFDNELQNTPSQKFWNLQGQQVVIDGFMGEVLSFEGGWFLLIPAPGAECPFDNGDETYWNKIMIIFVKEKEGLRFTGGPLRITGRLDVGIKVDESNYKTMFRLYDATFEPIK